MYLVVYLCVVMCSVAHLRQFWSETRSPCFSRSAKPPCFQEGIGSDRPRVWGAPPVHSIAIHHPKTFHPGRLVLHAEGASGSRRALALAVTVQFVGTAAVHLYHFVTLAVKFWLYHCISGCFCHSLVHSKCVRCFLVLQVCSGHRNPLSVLVQVFRGRARPFPQRTRGHTAAACFSRHRPSQSPSDIY